MKDLINWLRTLANLIEANKEVLALPPLANPPAPAPVDPPVQPPVSPPPANPPVDPPVAPPPPAPSPSPAPSPAPTPEPVKPTMTLKTPGLRAGVFKQGDDVYARVEAEVGGAALNVKHLVLTMREPGTTHGSGPFHDFVTQNDLVLQPGTHVVEGTRKMSTSDKTGHWEIYLTWANTDGQWFDGPSAYFRLDEVATASPPPPPAPAPNPSTPTTPSTPTDKLVFAHYFPPYPISFDNKPPDQDHYAIGYLTINGEGGKHAAYGGFLRDRQIGRNPLPGTKAEWMLQDMLTEVRNAKAMGIDGFTVDLLSNSGMYHEFHHYLCQAADMVGGFKIMLCPDMDTGWSKNRDSLVSYCVDFANRYQCIFKHNGKLVITSFNTMVSPPHQSPQGPIDANWWAEARKAFERAGYPIHQIPMTLDWVGYASKLDHVSDGHADWGWRAYTSQDAFKQRGHQMRKQYPNKTLFWPAAPQDSRPKADFYRESEGVKLLERNFNDAIETNMDWIQIVTWNDYSEHSHVCPSMNTGWFWHEACKFLTHKFKYRVEPEIQTEKLFGLYHRHVVGAPVSGHPKLQKKLDAGEEKIQLVSFLKEPAVGEILVNGVVRATKNLDKGMQYMDIKEIPGTVVFRLKRNGTVFKETKPVTIATQTVVQSMMYHSVEAA